MKVLLIEPPFHRFMSFYRHYYPLGLAYLAGVLASDNHVVEIYDAEHDSTCTTKTFFETSQDYVKYLEALKNLGHPVWLEIKRKIAESQPELIGISVLTVKVPSALRVASLCHEVCEDVPVVVGGEHATARPQDLLKDYSVNFVVRGEGEQTIRELAGALEGCGRLTDIDGLSFRNNDRIYHNKDRALIDNLDNLPNPARDMLAGKETYRPIDFGLVMGSRGCPYRCTFCPNENLWGKRTRFRSVRAVVKEIKMVQDTYSTDYFSFRDYSFSVNPHWTIEFCKAVKQEGLDIQWECLTRPDLLNDRIVSSMKDAGCTTIRVGIESGSEKVLNDIRKDLSLKKVRETAKVLNRHNIYWGSVLHVWSPLRDQRGHRSISRAH